MNRSLLFGLFTIAAGISPLRAQITEYTVPFNGLSGIAAGPDGAMWFSGNRTIGRITTNGTVTSFAVPTSNDTSYSITAGPDGAMWFTETALNSGNPFAKIGRIAMTGMITEFSLPDPNAIPSSITTGSDGALWFIESGLNKIGRMTTSGSFSEFSLPASEKNFGAYWITSGPDGNLWMTEYYSTNKIMRMTMSGDFTIFTITASTNAGSLVITTGPDGAMWFTDQNSKVGRITTSGSITEFPLPKNTVSPVSIATGPDGALWFTDSAGQIERMTTSGNVTSQTATPSNTAGGFLGHIAAGRDGAMWFTELGGKVGKIPTGVVTTPPSITTVANAEGEAPTIAPNTWVLIKGSNLAKLGTGRIWQDSDFSGGQMPTQLDGVSVTVNGKAAFVYYISPTQVNILTPPDAMTGAVQVVVNDNGLASAGFTAQAAAISPSFFVFSGGPYIAAVHLYGGLVGPTTLSGGLTTPAAQPGETIIIYANGFGPTSSPVVNGSPTQGGILSPLPVCTIGGQSAQVTFAGLVAPGEFQFNVVVPKTLANNDQPVTCSYGGQNTQSGTLLSVHQ